MKRNDCPCCRSNNIKPFINEFEKGYDLYTCKSCSVIFSNPFESAKADFYTNAKDVASKSRHESLAPLHKQHPSRKCEQLKNGDGKVLLDIGCGNGAFASFANENGLRAYGIDIDKSSLSAAKSRNLTSSTFYEATLDNLNEYSDIPEKFDIITMFEVFEHIENPNETIEKIKSLLKPDGLFIGSLPNVARTRMWTMNMDYERPPYHLTYWTIQTWRHYLKEHEIELVFAENNNYYGYMSDVLRIVTLKSLKMPVLKDIIAIILLGVKKYIESPIEIIAKQGASFFFVSKKQL